MGEHKDKEEEEQSARAGTYRGMRCKIGWLLKLQHLENNSTLKITIAILKLILWRTGSQCKSERTGVMWQNQSFCATTRAKVFWTC